MQYNQLTLNGETSKGIALKQKAIAKIADPTIPTWEKNIWLFVEAWLNDSSEIVLKTSGSTGIAKTIVVNKQNMVNSALMTGTYFGFEANQVALLCLSAEYIAGKMMIVRALVWGLNLWTVEPSKNPLQALSTTINIDFVAMVPLQVAESLKDTHSQAIFQRIKTTIIGGAPIPKTLQIQIQAGANKCYATFGMTETLSHVAIQVLNGPCADGYYYGLKNVKLLMDKRGCLVIDAPHLHEEKLITNDLVVFKNPDVFRFLGRYDNLVNSGGVKLIPEVLEAKIAGLLSEAYFFIGEKDKALGERLVLVIESETWNAEKQAQFQEALKAVLGKYECPKAIYFKAIFERTPTGKVRRVLGS